jgi:hypothetical protein
MKALRTGDAMIGSAAPYSLVGKSSVVMELGAGSEANGTQSALEAYRKVLATSTEPRLATASPEERFQQATAAALRRALGKTESKVTGARVSVDLDIALDDAERADVDAYYASRKQRLDALGRVVAAVLEGRPAADDDVLVAGGEALERAMKARATPGTKERPPSQKISFGGIAAVIPEGGVAEENPLGVLAQYSGGSEPTVEHCFTLLRGEGFHLRVTGLASRGPVLEVTRGSERFRLLVSKQEKSLDLFFLNR